MRRGLVVAEGESAGRQVGTPAARLWWGRHEGAMLGLYADPFRANIPQGAGAGENPSRSAHLGTICTMQNCLSDLRLGRFAGLTYREVGRVLVDNPLEAFAPAVVIVDGEPTPASSVTYLGLDFVLGSDGSRLFAMVRPTGLSMPWPSLKSVEAPTQWFEDFSRVFVVAEGTSAGRQLDTPVMQLWWGPHGRSMLGVQTTQTVMRHTRPVLPGDNLDSFRYYAHIGGIQGCLLDDRLASFARFDPRHAERVMDDLPQDAFEVTLVRVDDAPVAAGTVEYRGLDFVIGDDPIRDAFVMVRPAGADASWPSLRSVER